MMEVGVQVSSLKPLLQSEEAVTLAFQKLAQMGCRTVQLQWIDPSVPVPAIARALEESGLRSVSVQDFYEQVRRNLSYYIELNRSTRGTLLCVSRIPDRLKSREGLDIFVQELKQLQALLTPWDQKLCLHPVSADFTAVAGMNAVEYLLEAMPQMDICLDLYHLGRNCAHMPGFIRRYAGRVVMVHFKDSRDGRLVPAGQGDTNWQGVVAACQEVGVPYAFAEQETWDRDPYACLQEAIDWVNAQITSPLEF